MAMTGVIGALRTVYTNGTATCAPGLADEINEDLAIEWFELALARACLVAKRHLRKK